MLQFANKKNIIQTDIWEKIHKTKKILKKYVLLENNQQITHVLPKEKTLSEFQGRFFSDSVDIYIYIYVVPSISFQTFLYRHLKLSKTLQNSLCYCYTSYEMTAQFL